MSPDIVNWVKQEASRLQAVPVSAAFVHIPVPEFLQAWNHGTSVGMKTEAVCCPSCNSGLYQTLVCVPHTPLSHFMLPLLHLGLLIEDHFVALNDVHMP